MPAPEAYETKLPADFVVPEGVEYKFNEADPALTDFRKFANETGMSQEQFSKALGFYAAAKVSDQQTINLAHAAEVSKLGANGPARTTAAHTWLDAKGYGAIKQVMVTAELTQTVEKMMRDFSSQGAASPQGRRDVPGQPGKVSEEQWGRMSAAERMDHTNNTDQSQFKAA